MSRRLLGVLMVVLMALALAAPAMAAEAGGDEEGDIEVEEEKLPSYEDVGSGTETAKQFRPEPYEQPTLFTAILYPLLIIAFVAILGVLGLYLWWQPRFSQEREAKKRR